MASSLIKCGECAEKPPILTWIPVIEQACLYRVVGPVSVFIFPNFLGLISKGRL
jgi:hypothetical protein